VDIIAIKDNTTALAEGASGAPEIYQKATLFSARAQVFATAGSGQSFTIPTGVIRLKVTVVGGGGGSTTGGTSSVSSGTQSITTISATGGGVNTSGLGSNGDVNLRGGLPAVTSISIGLRGFVFVGGSSYIGQAHGGAADTNSFGAGRSGSVNFDPCTGASSLTAGGGGGGTAIKWLSVTSGTLSVTVGAAGSNGGQQGVVIFEW
jgi:hypothetical protein